jgi:hypothetical protein
MSALSEVVGIGRKKPATRNPATKLTPTIVAVPTAWSTSMIAQPHNDTWIHSAYEVDSNQVNTVKPSRKLFSTGIDEG